MYMQKYGFFFKGQTNFICIWNIFYTFAPIPNKINMKKVIGCMVLCAAAMLVVSCAEKPKSDFEDRAAALKAIGDLGTPQSRAYLEKERARLDKLTDAEAVRAKGLIGLYLD